MARRTTGLLALAAFGVLLSCGRKSLFTEPAPEDAETVIVALRHNGQVSVFAGEARAFALGVEVDDDDPLFVGFYKIPLAQLGLEEIAGTGRLVPLTLTTDGLSLEGFLVGWTRRYALDETWKMTTIVPDEFEAVRFDVESQCQLVRELPIRTVSTRCTPSLVTSVSVVEPVVAPEFATPDCSNGTIPLTDVSATVCVPFAPDVPDCGAHEVFVFGSGRCEPITNRACDEWPTNDPDAVYVDAETNGGLGTQAQPYQTLDEAIANSVPGQTIVMAAGQYESAVPIALVARRILGACVSAVSVDVADMTVEGVSAIEGVTLRTGTLSVGAGAVLTVDDTRLELRGGGLSVDDASLTVRRSRIVGLAPGPQALLQAHQTASIVVGDAMLDGPATIAIYATGASTTTIDGVVIRGSQLGIALEEAAALNARRVVAEDLVSGALIVNSTSVVEVEQALFREVAQTSIYVGANLDVRLRQVHIVRPGGAAMEIVAGTVLMSEVTVDSPRVRFAIDVSAGANVDARSLHITGAPAGISIRTAATATLTAVVIHGDNHPAVLDGALVVTEGAALTVNDGAFNGIVGRAIEVSGPGSRGYFTDIEIAHVASVSETRLGFGIAVSFGAKVLVSRASIRDVVGDGINVGSAMFIGSDLIIDGVRSNAEHYNMGNGVAGNAAYIALERISIRDVARRALFTAATSLDVTDADIQYPRAGEGIYLYCDDACAQLGSSRLTRIHMVGTDAPVFSEIQLEPIAIKARYGVAILHDIFVENAERIGVEIETPVESLVDRLRIEHTTGDGLVIHSDSKSRLSNISVVDTRNPPGPSESYALRLSAVDVHITDFELLESEAVALRVDEVGETTPPAKLEGGRIIDASTGLLVSHKGLDNVTFSDVIIADAQIEVRTVGEN